MKKLTEYVHSRGKRMLSHNCGNNWKIMDILIEAGYEAYQSIQIKNAGMDLKKLKEKHGRDIALWGGINIETMVAGTPDEIEAEVKYALKHGAPGGGFILGTSNSVAFGSKYENYQRALAMLAQYGKYPISVA
jgi:uroporphyrinogen decarboxylase